MENINLVEILRNCPKGTKLYSPIFGEVEFIGIVNNNNHPISVIDKTGTVHNFDVMGKYYHYYNDAECVLFPSKDQRDWTKFRYYKSKFDIHTLKPFDKVLARVADYAEWNTALFSHISVNGVIKADGCAWKHIIPYNEETKHLIGTTEEPSEYYR